MGILYKESSFWNIFSSEYWVMYRVQKSINSECVIPSSVPLGLNNIYGLFLHVLIGLFLGKWCENVVLLDSSMFLRW